MKEKKEREARETRVVFELIRENGGGKKGVKEKRGDSELFIIENC